MLEKQFDQSSLPCPKLPMNAASGQAMQKSYRLLREQLFKFFRGHEGILGLYEVSQLHKSIHDLTLEKGQAP